jgi:uncharacterized membrane protein
MKRICTIALFAAMAMAQACGSDGEDLPTVDCQSGTIPTYTEIKTTALAKCTSCHASAVKGDLRVQAPESVNFDTFAAAKAEAKQAAIEVNAGAMPPAGLTPLSAEEKEALYRWALCGTKE